LFLENVVRLKTKQFLLIGIIAVLGIGAYLSYNAFFVQEEPEINEQNDQNDMFYLAVGLYAYRTHPCPKHIEEECDSEFKNALVNYTILSDDKEFFLQDSAITRENGFFDLYLPKGKAYVASFTVDGKTGTGIFPTKPGSSNCITDIKVQ
jgi:hypothetical protein